MKTKEVVELYNAISSVKFFGIEKDDAIALLKNMQVCKPIYETFESMRQAAVEKCKPEGYDKLSEYVTAHTGDKVTPEIAVKLAEYNSMRARYTKVLDGYMNELVEYENLIEIHNISLDSLDKMMKSDGNKEVKSEYWMALYNLANG